MMATADKPRASCGERGQSAIEFVLIAPLAFVMIGAIVTLALLGVRVGYERLRSFDAERKAYLLAHPGGKEGTMLRRGDNQRMVCIEGEGEPWGC